MLLRDLGQQAAAQGACAYRSVCQTYMEARVAVLTMVLPSLLATAITSKQGPTFVGGPRVSNSDRGAWDKVVVGRTQHVRVASRVH